MKQYTEKQRIIVVIPGGILFLIVIPLILIIISSFIDNHLYLPKLMWGFLNFIIASFFIVPGLLFSVWSVWIQFRIGKGTPAPMMPSQKLIVDGPYAYCRNPMTLGVLLFYFGIGIWIGSLSLIGLVILLMVLFLVYIKLVEEEELKERFGQEYTEYKKRTPFLIPRRKNE